MRGGIRAIRGVNTWTGCGFQTAVENDGGHRCDYETAHRWHVPLKFLGDAAAFFGCKFTMERGHTLLAVSLSIERLHGEYAALHELPRTN